MFVVRGGTVGVQRVEMVPTHICTKYQFTIEELIRPTFQDKEESFPANPVPSYMIQREAY